MNPKKNAAKNGRWVVRTWLCKGWGGWDFYGDLSITLFTALIYSMVEVKIYMKQKISIKITTYRESAGAQNVNFCVKTSCHYFLLFHSIEYSAQHENHYNYAPLSRLVAWSSIRLRRCVQLYLFSLMRFDFIEFTCTDIMPNDTAAFFEIDWA